jgi:hypothetical protein
LEIKRLRFNGYLGKGRILDILAQLYTTDLPKILKDECFDFPGLTYLGTLLRGPADEITAGAVLYHKHGFGIEYSQEHEINPIIF